MDDMSDPCTCETMRTGCLVHPAGQRRTHVAVPPEVARLIEAVGPDNLPALVRVAYEAAHYSTGTFSIDALDRSVAAVSGATWERLGEALDGGA